VVERPSPFELPPRPDGLIRVASANENPRRKPQLVEVAPAEPMLVGERVKPEDVGSRGEADRHCDRRSLASSQERLVYTVPRSFVQVNVCDVVIRLTPCGALRVVNLHDRNPVLQRSGS